MTLKERINMLFIPSNTDSRELKNLKDEFIDIFKIFYILYFIVTFANSFTFSLVSIVLNLFFVVLFIYFYRKFNRVEKLILIDSRERIRDIYRIRGYQLLTVLWFYGMLSIGFF